MEETKTEQEVINIDQSIVDFQNNIVDVISNAKLPPLTLKLALNDVYTFVISNINQAINKTVNNNNKEGETTVNKTL